MSEPNLPVNVLTHSPSVEIATTDGSGQNTGDQVPTASGARAKFAGKYETPDAFEKGILEARKAVGLPDLPDGSKLIGQDGLYADVRAAEIGYRDLTTMLRIKSEIKPPLKPAEPQAKPGDKSAKLQIEQNQPDAVQDATVTDILGKAGLQLDALAEQWTTDKKLTDAQYAALRAVNPAYTRSLVDSAIAGLMAQRMLGEHLAVQARTRAVELAGGQEQLGNLFEWAKTNLTPVEKDKFNKRLDDIGEYEDAVLALIERHRRAVGAENSQKLLGGTHANPVAVGGFTTDSDPADFFATLRKAQSGDAVAMKRISDTSPEVFSKLTTG